MQFMQLRFHLSYLCDLFSLCANLNLSCLCLGCCCTDLTQLCLFYAVSCWYLAASLLIETRATFAFQHVCALHFSMSCLCSAHCWCSSLISIIHSVPSPVLLCSALCMSQRSCSPKDFTFLSSKIFKFSFAVMPGFKY